MDDYTIVKPVWAVRTVPGGPLVKNVTGTVQDVIQYANKVNRNFREDFDLEKRDKVTGVVTKKISTVHGNITDVAMYHCDYGVAADEDAILQGILDLRTVQGSVSLGPAGGPDKTKCAVLSCFAGGNAIYWCNQVSDSLGTYLPTPKSMILIVV